MILSHSDNYQSGKINLDNEKKIKKGKRNQGNKGELEAGVYSACGSDTLARGRRELAGVKARFKQILLDAIKSYCLGKVGRVHPLQKRALSSH